MKGFLRALLFGAGLDGLVQFGLVLGDQFGLHCVFIPTLVQLCLELTDPDPVVVALEQRCCLRIDRIRIIRQDIKTDLPQQLLDVADAQRFHRVTEGLYGDPGVLARRGSATGEGVAINRAA